MSLRSARLAQNFTWCGHGYTHLLTALYLTVVLALEKEWHLPYGQLIQLWTVGALFMGLGAPLAGWLGDRWSMPWMMILFFLGSGLSTIAAGLSNSPLELGAALGALGLFASIFHPVGMAWLVRTATRPGFSIGIFGIFGSCGVAFAGVLADLLIHYVGWRGAFIIPGASAVLLGLALAVYRRAGLIIDHKIDMSPASGGGPSRRDAMRAFWVLSVTVVCTGLIYAATQTVMPKLFEVRIGDSLAGTPFGPGTLFTLVYLASGAFQLVGGWVADHFPLRVAYVLFFALQLPMLYLAGSVTGLPIVAVALLMVLFNSGSQPAENLLLSRFTPAHWRATAFGAKFILAFGVTPLAVQLVAWTYGARGDFYWLFVTLCAFAVVVILAAFLLPTEERPARRAVAVAAE